MNRCYYKVFALLAVLFTFVLTGCGSAVAEKDAGAAVPNNIERKAAERMLNIEVNGKILHARLEDNSSSRALIKLLESGPLTVSMQDYGNFEKVGTLPQSLPANDRHWDVTAGDLILYQQNKIVIYYDRNSWNFTKLGRLENISGSDLKSLLGQDGVQVTFSMAE